MRRAARRIPLASTEQLAGSLQRARIVRLVLAGALLVALVVAWAGARSLEQDSRALVPRGTNVIVVLDLSASISSTVYRQVGRVLDRAARGGGTAGLVVFSDTAYEALPPGTPAGQLRGFARFFTPLRGGTNVPIRGGRAGATLRLGQYAFPANPWSNGFTAGTRISEGLRLAGALVARDRVEHPRVVLISDLATDQSDIPALSNTLLTYKENGVPIRIVGISPSVADERLFRSMLGADALTREPLPPPRPVPVERTGTDSAFPALLVAASAVLLALLALNELWCARLTWRRTTREAPA